jgi:hypothetical protein
MFYAMWRMMAITSSAYMRKLVSNALMTVCLVFSEVTGAGNAAQHEESGVMWVDGSQPINHFTCLVVVIEGLAHEVDVLRE